MARVKITVASHNYDVKFLLQGVPEGATATSNIDGSIAPTVVWALANPPTPPKAVVRYGYPIIEGYGDTGDSVRKTDVLGNDEICPLGTYYQVEVIDPRSKLLISEDWWAITGEFYDLDIETPLAEKPIPNSPCAPQGFIFNAGPTGYTGPIGFTGYTGTQGATGYTGPEGEGGGGGSYYPAWFFIW